MADLNLTPNTLRKWRDAGKTIDSHEVGAWHARIRIDKYNDPDNQMSKSGRYIVRAPQPWWRRFLPNQPQEYQTRQDLSKASSMFREWMRGLLTPYDYFEWEGNILMTVGATDLWNGFVTAGLATPYNSTNAGLGVGDSSTAASAAQTDLQAAIGSTTITTSGFTSVTNATPIVYVNGSGSWTSTPYGTNASAPATIGNVLVVSALTTNTAANGTFELRATTNTTTFTALNSAGNGVTGSLSSGLAKPINRYIQLVNGVPSVSTNQVQFVSVFGSTNANHLWNEMCTTNGAAATNIQQAPPSPHMGNRFVSSMGTKGSGSSWTATETISLS